MNIDIHQKQPILPLDVIDLCLACFSQLPKRESTRLLQTCSMVSRSMKCLSQRYLFATFRINCEPPTPKNPYPSSRLHDLAALLKSDPQFRECIHNVEIYVWSDSGTIQDQLSSLASLLDLLRKLGSSAPFGSVQSFKLDAIGPQGLDWNNLGSRFTRSMLSWLTVDSTHHATPPSTIRCIHFANMSQVPLHVVTQCPIKDLTFENVSFVDSPTLFSGQSGSGSGSTSRPIARTESLSILGLTTNLLDILPSPNTMFSSLKSISTTVRVYAIDNSENGEIPSPLWNVMVRARKSLQSVEIRNMSQTPFLPSVFRDISALTSLSHLKFINTNVGTLLNFFVAQAKGFPAVQTLGIQITTSLNSRGQELYVCDPLCQWTDLDNALIGRKFPSLRTVAVDVDVRATGMILGRREGGEDERVERKVRGTVLLRLPRVRSSASIRLLANVAVIRVDSFTALHS